MNPQQPSGDPYPYGPPPSGPYPPQGHGPPPAGAFHQGYAPYQPVPDRMPGTVVTVRVLMFVGGACGVLAALLFWVLAASLTGEFSRGATDAFRQQGLVLTAAEGALVFGVLGAIPFVYGVLSLVLASFMGRRRPAVLWSVVVFQALSALTLLVSLVAGDVLLIVPLLFTIAMIVFVLLEPARAYYTRPIAPPSPAGY
ncbi:hypothetical protein [Nocardiopsis sp. CNT312]|uniref:hypothetical protein n=1 Tax=Nocardiopsis sp. CNT312 TaxID=1137268 RepID=UPI00048C056E|nr:hypothetical protein [Nocardiopsis sp. CNT312]